ncbi:MAG: hypothetical protein IKO40_05165 [Kiritimatiellae bacterium]|nr:hypothetical protein [Kiritimatiellia bacterium]
MEKMSQEEMVRLISDYDERAAKKLSPREQVELLIEIHKMKRIDPALGMPNDTPHLLLSTDFVFVSSFRILDLFHPAFLATLPYDRQAFLAAIGSRVRRTAVLYDGIIYSSSILTSDSRALFCVPQMMGRHWTTGRLFFNHLLEKDAFAARINGAEAPTFPASFCPSDFFHYFPNSFANNLPEGLRQAIEDDSPARFAIARSLCGRRMTRNLFLFMLQEGAVEILAANLKALSQQLAVVPLVLFCASSVAAPVAIRLLQAIDDDSPGTVANARDIFGNSAFWYSIYRSGNLPWEDERDFKALEAALLALGCDPNAPNRLDLTFSSIMKAQRALAAFQSV